MKGDAETTLQQITATTKEQSTAEPARQGKHAITVNALAFLTAQEENAETTDAVAAAAPVLLISQPTARPAMMKASAITQPAFIVQTV